MRKRKSLDINALSDAVATPIEPVKKLEAQAAGKPLSRANTVQIGVHLLPEKRQKLKQISLETGIPINMLMLDALDLLFAKHSKIKTH